MKSVKIMVAAFALALLPGCGGGDSGAADASQSDRGDGAVADAGRSDTAPPAGTPDSGETDTPAPDSGCADAETRCSEDALLLEICVSGSWTVGTDCMAEGGQLCEDGACVDPWRYGVAPVGTCADDPHATSASLSEKATRYQGLAERLHLHPRHKRLQPVHLPDGLSEDDATWEDVVRWDTGENDGLWTGLYIASQAFRVAVTGDEAAVAHLRVLLDGMRIGMEITGVPGIFTREYVTPGIEGMGCTSDMASYVPDVEKDDNRWVRVGVGGFIETWSSEDAAFVASEHRVDTEFEGYCWLDNVSQDEYAGHMLALALVVLLVEDGEARAQATELLDRVGSHLLDNHMALVDWDGRTVEHGRLWPFAMDNFPGFNAVLGLAYVKMAAVATGRDDLRDYYENCLLQRAGPKDCIEQTFARPEPYTDALPHMGLYPDPPACKANWNNFAMAWVAMFPLIWMERDPEIRATYQQAFADEFWRKGSPRDMALQHNAAWGMMYAAMKATGPGTDGQDVAAIEDALCGLRQFPEYKSAVSVDLGEADLPTDDTCASRFAGSFLTIDPAPVWQRCPRTFLWWGNPYHHQRCTADPTWVQPPSDYLLPYWMARYFGWIGAGD